MTTTLVDPTLAPFGREPLAVGVDYIEFKSAAGIQRYRTEAWRLTTGETVVVVSDNGGLSLANALERIEEAIRARWSTDGSGLEIVEHWGGKTFRQHYNLELDLNALDARGIVLPR